MFNKEIRVPKEVREFMMDGAVKTVLGFPEGAKRQYRYGNLHIREYDGSYMVHMDRVSPLQSPLRHLLYDAPEVLVGLGGAAVSGMIAAYAAYKKSGSRGSTVCALAGVQAARNHY